MCVECGYPCALVPVPVGEGRLAGDGAYIWHGCVGPRVVTRHPAPCPSEKAQHGPQACASWASLMLEELRYIIDCHG